MQKLRVLLLLLMLSTVELGRALDCKTLVKRSSLMSLATLGAAVLSGGTYFIATNEDDEDKGGHLTQDLPARTVSSAENLNGHSLRETPDVQTLVNLPEWSGTKNWKQIAELDLGRQTYHPQGIIVLGNRVLLSTVETKFVAMGEKAWLIAYDMTPGNNSIREIWRHGFDEAKKVNQCHPGGMDTDGNRVFIPLAVYRKGYPSKIISYPVTTLTQNVDPGEPKSIIAEFTDHIGGVAITGSNCSAINWGTNKIYSANLKGSHQEFEQIEFSGIIEGRSGFERVHEYQDCKGIDEGIAICGGKTKSVDGQSPGVIDIIKIEGNRYEVLRRIIVPPVSGGIIPTFNTLDVQVAKRSNTETTLHFFFAPNNMPNTKLRIYEVKVPK